MVCPIIGGAQRCGRELCSLVCLLEGADCDFGRFIFGPILVYVYASFGLVGMRFSGAHYAKRALMRFAAFELR